MGNADENNLIEKNIEYLNSFWKWYTQYLEFNILVSHDWPEKIWDNEKK